MKRKIISFACWAFLALSINAMMIFFLIKRPYDPEASTNAPWKVISAQLKRDHSFYWLHVQLKPKDQATTIHTIGQSSIQLKTIDGQSLNLANFSWDSANPSLKLSFWIEQKDLAQPLNLHFDGSTYRIKGMNSLPKLDNQEEKTFQSYQF